MNDQQVPDPIAINVHEKDMTDFMKMWTEVVGGVNKDDPTLICSSISLERSEEHPKEWNGFVLTWRLKAESKLYRQTDWTDLKRFIVGMILVVFMVGVCGCVTPDVAAPTTAMKVESVSLGPIELLLMEDGSVRWKENEALTPPSLSADYFIEHGNDGRGIE